MEERHDSAAGLQESASWVLAVGAASGLDFVEILLAAAASAAVRGFFISGLLIGVLG